MDDSRRQQVITELATAIAAVARGDDDEAIKIVAVLARGFASQQTLPGMPPAPPKLPVDAARKELALDLVAYWRRECGHETAKSTVERVTAVLARLKEGYSAAEIRKAIDGAKHAAYVDDKGKKHDELTLICRNGSKLEDFIARGVNATGAVLVEKPSEGGLDEQIANLRRSMATMRRDGRQTEYDNATRELHVLMARREVRPPTLRSAS